MSNLKEIKCPLNGCNHKIILDMDSGDFVNALSIQEHVFNKNFSNHDRQNIAYSIGLMKMRELSD